MDKELRTILRVVDRYLREGKYTTAREAVAKALSGEEDVKLDRTEEATQIIKELVNKEGEPTNPDQLLAIVERAYQFLSEQEETGLTGGKYEVKTRVGRGPWETEVIDVHEKERVAELQNLTEKYAKMIRQMLEHVPIGTYIEGIGDFQGEQEDDK